MGMVDELVLAATIVGELDREGSVAKASFFLPDGSEDAVDVYFPAGLPPSLLPGARCLLRCHVRSREGGGADVVCDAAVYATDAKGRFGKWPT